jgi:uncharacterized protein DUF6152
MRQRLAGMALLVVAWVVPALAHHPFAAEYDWKRPTTISGTVTKFDWANPHAILVVKGTDEAGTAADWTIELGSPGNLTRLGWSTHQLKVGDKVSVDGWLAKNGRRQLSAKSVRAPGGRELTAASSFFDEGKSTAITDPGTQHEAVSNSVRP